MRLCLPRAHVEGQQLALQLGQLASGNPLCDLDARQVAGNLHGAGREGAGDCNGIDAALQVLNERFDPAIGTQTLGQALPAASVTRPEEGTDPDLPAYRLTAATAATHPMSFD